MQSIFFVLLIVDVLHDLQRDIDSFVDRSEYECQQRQNLQQSHRASLPLCTQASGGAAFQKKSFSRFT